jgi:hypothetical protein
MLFVLLTGLHLLLGATLLRLTFGSSQLVVALFGFLHRFSRFGTKRSLHLLTVWNLGD